MKVSREGKHGIELAASSRSFGGSTVSILLSTRIFVAALCGSRPADGLDFGVDAFVGIDEQGGHFGVAGAAPGRSHHGPVEPAFRREDSRRVDKDDLGRAFEGNAAHRAARRLNLAGNDRDLRSDELVDERRFAGVRRADEGDKTAACWTAASGCSRGALLALWS